VLELSAISVERFQVFLIATARIAALTASIPVLSGAQTPARIKIVLAFILSLLVFPLVEPEISTVPFDTLHLFFLILSESVVGLAIGFSATLIFAAVQFGGTVVGYQMGFAAANVFDPQTQNQTALVSQFQNVLAILVFLALNIHFFMIEAIVHSFRLLPPGNLNLSGGAIPYLMTLAGRMFSLGVQFSAPVLVVLLLSGLVLGLMSRVFPQLNVFLLSFPINIGLAFLMLSLTLNLTVALMTREFATLQEHILMLFSLF